MPEQMIMTIVTDDIYRSSNGDCWKLVRDTSTGRMVVRHEPNQASGGGKTDTDVEDFLRIEGSGPEFATLRRLLGKSPDQASPVHKDD